jgi:hypothetical protein
MGVSCGQNRNQNVFMYMDYSHLLGTHPVLLCKLCVDRSVTCCCCCCTARSREIHGLSGTHPRARYQVQDLPLLWTSCGWQ